MYESFYLICHFPLFSAYVKTQHVPRLESSLRCFACMHELTLGWSRCQFGSQTKPCPRVRTEQNSPSRVHMFVLDRWKKKSRSKRSKILFARWHRITKRPTRMFQKNNQTISRFHCCSLLVVVICMFVKRKWPLPPAKPVTSFEARLLNGYWNFSGDLFYFHLNALKSYCPTVHVERDFCLL